MINQERKLTVPELIGSFQLVQIWDERTVDIDAVRILLVFVYIRFFNKSKILFVHA